MDRVVALVQARLASERLPRKALLELPKHSGVTVLGRVLERLDKCKLLDSIVLITPDEELASFKYLYSLKPVLQRGIGFSIYDKPKRDVLDEFFIAAKRFPAEHYVRITGDCPLIIPELVDYVVASHLLSGADYTCNRNDDENGTLGDGQDVEVTTWETLVKTWVLAHDDYDREHVTSYMRKGNFKFKINRLQPYEWEGRSLNTRRDYKLLCDIYDKYALK